MTADRSQGSADFRNWLGNFIMESLDRHGESYHLVKRPADLAWSVADDLLAPEAKAALARWLVLASGASSETPDKGPETHVVTAGLDVERLARAMAGAYEGETLFERERLAAVEVARRYARLTPVAGSASEEDRDGR